MGLACCYKYVRPHTVFERVCLSGCCQPKCKERETFLCFCCASAGSNYAIRLLEILQAYAEALVLCDRFVRLAACACKMCVGF